MHLSSPRVTCIAGLPFVAVIWLAPVQTRAHHEAIFGPQSSILMSQESFGSAQAFTRRLRGPEGAMQDTTFLLSGGLSPFQRLPLSFVLTLPASYETGGGEDGHLHLEDLIVGARYRLNLARLGDRLGGEAFLLLSAALELPTGTAHDGFGPNLSALPAALASFERGRLSTILFAFAGLNGDDSAGSRQGHELFLGGGVGYAIVASPDRLLSAQLGASYERRFHDRISGEPVLKSGGRAVLLSPTLVAGFGDHWQVFAMASLPVYGTASDPDISERWRAGLGIIYAFGHEH
jgi:hypothetical protein